MENGLSGQAFALAEESGEMQAALEAYGKVVELTEATAGQEVDAEVTRWPCVFPVQTTGTLTALRLKRK